MAEPATAQSSSGRLQEDHAATAALLEPSEKSWLARYQYLYDKGYELRPRYRPGWVAPWKPLQKDYYRHEDSITPWLPFTLDAQRLSDRKAVYLKVVSKESPEVEIGMYLSSPEVIKDPRNHSVPFLDVLDDSVDAKQVIIVMPVLRGIGLPLPASLGECVDFVDQMLEGLVFLHEHKIAHRDCLWANIMMDGRGLYPEGWHPQDPHRDPQGRQFDWNDVRSRTAVGGVRYYFIDFGISSWKQDLVTGLAGRQLAPELLTFNPYDPYKVDVYLLGIAFQHVLIEECVGVDFIQPVIDYMTQKDPASRPSALEAFEKFKTIRATIKTSQLSKRVQSARRPDSGLTRILNDAKYRVRDKRWRKQPHTIPEPLL